MSRNQIDLNSADTVWWDFRNEALRLVNETTGDFVHPTDKTIERAKALALVGILDVLGNILEAITVDDEDDPANGGLAGFKLEGSDS